MHPNSLWAEESCASAHQRHYYAYGSELTYYIPVRCEEEPYTDRVSPVEVRNIISQSQRRQPPQGATVTRVQTNYTGTQYAKVQNCTKVYTTSTVSNTGDNYSLPLLPTTFLPLAYSSLPSGSGQMSPKSGSEAEPKPRPPTLSTQLHDFDF